MGPSTDSLATGLREETVNYFYCPNEKSIYRWPWLPPPPPLLWPPPLLALACELPPPLLLLLDAFELELAVELDRSRTIGGAICNERGLLYPELP